MATFSFEVETPPLNSPFTQENPFLLASTDSSSSTGRWIIAGAEPHFSLAWKEGLEVRGDLPEKILEEARSKQGSLESLATVVDWFGGKEKSSSVQGPHDFPFVGGAVGFFSYEFARHLERLPVPLKDPTNLPDYWFGLYGGAIIYDQREQRAWAVGVDNPFASAKEEALRAAQRLEEQSPVPWSLDDASEGEPANVVVPQSDWHQSAFYQARELIEAGDIYQVNLTGQFQVPQTTSPQLMWERMQREAPAPFAAYVDSGSCAVLSASPERFLKLDGCDVEMRPIKGTRPRGNTPKEDAILKNELTESAKDRAELLMIVDLHRNDLGRVCEVGSVAVPTLFGVRTFSTVHHLEATVTGRLAKNRDRWDLLRATFPAGSVTGTPKIRAMEVIADLEGQTRGVYCGAIGTMDVRGGLDLSVAIRSAVVQKEMVYYGAGGAIVWDSDAEGEYAELLTKARPFYGMLRP